ncbi:MAG: hypothetical protein G01um101438_911 [Parcubacteria group bacterium Gr01-1014_38]|nr:MAG: hypothetical protein G01um101438_911 [Parcubacteria group bacterium Gr01-1014_38]
MTDPTPVQQQVQLIEQQRDHVTIPTGQVPVLEYTSPGSVAAMAVNFLRCGCPMVQVLLETWGLAQAEACQSKTRSVLQALELPGEDLESSRSKDRPFVITITRWIR